MPTRWQAGIGVLVFILQICGASKYQGSPFLGMGLVWTWYGGVNHRCLIRLVRDGSAVNVGTVDNQADLLIDSES